MLKEILLLILVILNLLKISAQDALFELKQLNGTEKLENNTGIAIADYNQDGNLDFFIVAAHDYDSLIPSTYGGLFLNNNDATFKDVTNDAGLLGTYDFDFQLSEFEFFDMELRYGASWGDYNNDEYPDLYLTNYKFHFLYKNNGNGTFTDITEISGLQNERSGFSSAATWIDYNNDGFLDLIIPSWFENAGNKLFTNKGDDTFQDDTYKISDDRNKNTWMVLPTDINEDGWVDLFFVNDFVSNRLFINENGSFNDQTEAYNLGIADVRNSMGATYGDVDNDGDFDIYVTDINKNELWINENDQFINKASELNLELTDWSWKTEFKDYDLDGDLDLTIVNGYQRPFSNVYFQNNLIEEGSFSMINNSELVGFEQHTNSMSFGSFDIDHDGDQDILVTQVDDKILFIENNSSQINDNNWIKVELIGSLSNKDGIGSIVEVVTDNDLKIRKFYSGVGFMSQSLQPLTFGLGESVLAEVLTVKWPSGILDSYANLPVNNTIKITEGEGYEVVSRESNRISGCTDPESCNYNPEATIDNGSCEYISSGTISGSRTSGILSIENYNYEGLNNNESSIVWDIENAEILSGQGTPSIRVKWQIANHGKITAYESGVCRSGIASLDVDLIGSNRNTDYSIPRLWNSVLLEAIRNDYARPTVHARNLFHSSAIMYDLFVIYLQKGITYLEYNGLSEYRSKISKLNSNNVELELNEAISYAISIFIDSRFNASPDFDKTKSLVESLNDQLEFNGNSVNYEIGKEVVEKYLEFGLVDGSREFDDYSNEYYKPVNSPLAPDFSGNPSIDNPNRWQPLELIEFIDQSGNPVNSNTPEFLSPEWGNVKPFALDLEDQKQLGRDEGIFKIYHDPGPPPYISFQNESNSDSYYKWGFSLVSIWSSHLDPRDGVIWDISPSSIGNIDFEDFPSNWDEYSSFYNELDGGDIGRGRPLNPITNQPYEEQLVPRGDYTRVLAEFWADGPDSETPPGHWFTILNYVNDHPLFERKFEGIGRELGQIEWDIKSYFMLGGAMHDAAIAAWSVKGWYDYIRPISAIRFMADIGQSSDSTLINYNSQGIPLKNGLIELVKEGDELEGHNKENIGKIKLWSWKGHQYISDVTTDIAGVGWVLAENWWPYQRPSFVTPPFAGYVSGHSTYSRAAAEVFTFLTGSEYFPGGLGEFVAKKNEFLVFEQGPSEDVILQWATYRDASDQCSLSRIWGGIHPPADDIPGRLIGEKVGVDAFKKAKIYFNENKILNSNIYKNQISAYPNPYKSNEVLIIEGLSDCFNLQIFDMIGNRVTYKIESINPEEKILKIRFENTGLLIIKNESMKYKIVSVK